MELQIAALQIIFRRVGRCVKKISQTDSQICCLVVECVGVVRRAAEEAVYIYLLHYWWCCDFLKTDIAAASTQKTPQTRNQRISSYQRAAASRPKDVASCIFQIFFWKVAFVLSLNKCDLLRDLLCSPEDFSQAHMSTKSQWPLQSQRTDQLHSKTCVSHPTFGLHCNKRRTAWPRLDLGLLKLAPRGQAAGL